MLTSVRLSALTAILAASVAGLGAQQPPLERVNLPDGFSIEVYAEGLTNRRSMALSSAARCSGTAPADQADSLRR